MATYVRMVLFLFVFFLFGWAVTAQANNGLTTSSKQYAKQSYAYIAHGRYHGRYHQRYSRYKYRPRSHKRYYGRNYRYRHNRYYNHRFNRHYYPSRYYYRHRPYYRGYRHRGVYITIPLSQRKPVWKPASFGKVPVGARSLAYRYGNAIYSCRVKEGGLTHKGKLVLGNTCTYNCQGKTRGASYYDVLM